MDEKFTVKTRMITKHTIECENDVLLEALGDKVVGSYTVTREIFMPGSVIKRIGMVFQKDPELVAGFVAGLVGEFVKDVDSKEFLQSIERGCGSRRAVSKPRKAKSQKPRKSV